MGGGPGPHLDKNGHWVRQRVAGTVTVFDTHGKKVAHATVRASEPFHFSLPAGHYQLNQGAKLYFPRDCHPVSATVRSSATTHVDVSTGCWLP